MDSPSSYLRPVHLAVVAFLLGVLFTSAVVLATGSTTVEPADRGALLVTATFVRSSLYGEAPEATPAPVASLSEVDEASLPVEDRPQPRLEEPVLQPARSCDEIRDAGTYLDEDERSYFLDNCRTLTAASASSTAVTRPGVLTEAERAYRVRAESIAFSYRTSFQRYDREELTASEAALVEYGGFAGGWANQMDNFSPVPPRFQQAHDRLQVTLRELAAHTRLVASGQTQLPDEGYEEEFLRLVDAVDAASTSYFQVVGLELPLS